MERFFVIAGDATGVDYPHYMPEQVSIQVQPSAEQAEVLSAYRGLCANADPMLMLALMSIDDLEVKAIHLHAPMIVTSGHDVGTSLRVYGQNALLRR